MNWEKFKTELALEAKSYAADLRAFRDSLSSVEGWLALIMLLGSIFIVVAFLLVSVGFSPNPNVHILRFLQDIGLRACRTMDNVSGVFLFVTLFLLLFLAVITVGNVLNLLGRVKRGEPRQPRDIIVSSSLMASVGLGGIAYMLWAC